MQPEARKYLYDIQAAIERLGHFTTGQDFAAYQLDDLLRAAVERQLTIIGEAVSQLARVDRSLAQQLGDFRRTLALRNILIHAYADVDDRLVWDIVASRVGPLGQEVERILDTDG